MIAFDRMCFVHNSVSAKIIAHRSYTYLTQVPQRSHYEYGFWLVVILYTRPAVLTGFALICYSVHTMLHLLGHEP